MKIGSRTTALLATAAVAAGLSLGSTNAQADPSDPAADFLMKVRATSASFTPITGSTGEYRLVLRGVPSKVRVTELTQVETSAMLPLKAFMAYWTGYGDETGQFKTKPPRAVLQSAGSPEEVVVRLRDASRKGRTLSFDAEVVFSPAVWERLDHKVDEVDENPTPDELGSFRKPRVMADVEMFVDMPKKIIQPKPSSGFEGRALTRPTRSVRVGWPDEHPMLPDDLTCAGVSSSRLRMCWNEMESINDSGLDIEYRRNQLPWRRYPDDWPDYYSGFAFLDVGYVDLYPYYWRTGLSPYLNTRGQIRQRESWNDFGWDWTGRTSGYTSSPPHKTMVAVDGLWYGVHKDARTFYLTDRCTWFMASWAPDGKCW